MHARGSQDFLRDQNLQALAERHLQAARQRLASATRLRNVLVHAYVDIDPRRTWEALGNLDDLESFTPAIEKYVER